MGFRRRDVTFPNGLRDVNFAVLIVLPSHPANLTPPVSREGGDRENRCSRFGQDGQDCFDLGEAIRVGLLLLFCARFDRCVADRAFAEE